LLKEKRFLLVAATGLFVIFTLFSAQLFSTIAFTRRFTELVNDDNPNYYLMQQAFAQEGNTPPTLPFTPFSQQQEQEAVPGEEQQGQQLTLANQTGLANDTLQLRGIPEPGECEKVPGGIICDPEGKPRCRGDEIFDKTTGQCEKVVYTVHILAIRTADKDGKRPADINADQVRQWVDKANQIFAPAYIQFKLDPIPDPWDPLPNTVINNFDASGAALEEANRVASQFPDKLVVFFRHGYVIVLEPDTGQDTGTSTTEDETTTTTTTPTTTQVRHDDWHTGNGYSDKGLKFVAMPGFEHTGTIIGLTHLGTSGIPDWNGVQNIWLLSHEIGHYLNLQHTFPGNNCEDIETRAKASGYIASHGGLPSALDGDGLSDTPPDPCKDLYINQLWDPCVGHDSVTITGVTSDGMSFSYDFAPDRHNRMSYFDCDPMGFTPMQIDKMREALRSKAQEGLSIR